VDELDNVLYRSGMVGELIPGRDGVESLMIGPCGDRLVVTERLLVPVKEILLDDRPWQTFFSIEMHQ
jgi:hypothetical protein